MGKLALAVSQLDALFVAWRDVRAQVRKSSWPQITAELAAMEAAPLRVLRDIRSRLRQGRYEFSPKWGYVKRKSGGSRRGITVHGISDRIVQRSILNVVHTRDSSLITHLGEIPTMLDTPTTFAGTPGRGVPEAVAATVQAIREGAGALATSDMKDFFPRVPRGEVVEFFKANIADDEFTRLFEAALETEIKNRDEIAQWLELFPLSEVGVAQGSLLGVLVGNLSLRHFDVRLNAGSLTTIRYLDDFIILGPDLEAVSAGFEEAKDELAKLGMACYQPGDGSQKSFLGLTANGFDFLGCRIHPDGVTPARAARRKLLREVAEAIREGKSQIRDFQKNANHRRSEATYAQTLSYIDRKIRGWGDAYRFVSNRLTFAQLDAQIDRLIDGFRGWFSRQYRGADPRTRRRITGVALLGDTPPKSPKGGPAGPNAP
jgi:RNA-directed DNA polymerase